MIKPARPFGVTVALCLLLAVVFFGISIASNAGADTKQPLEGEKLLSIHVNGETQGVLTSEMTIGAALKQAGIPVNDQDLVEPSLDERLVASHYDVNIYRARPITIVDGPVRVKVTTPYQTPEQIARDAGMTMQDEDDAAMQTSVDLKSATAGLYMTIDRATPFTLVMYGKKIQAYTQATTVADMLAQKGIKLGNKDRLSVTADTPITDDMTVELWRDGKQTITVDETVAFPVEKIQDADRPVGYKKVTTPGVKGKKTVSYEIMMKNGKEVSRKQIQSVTTKEPKKQVEIVGAKVEGPESITAKIRAASTAKGIDAQRVLIIAKCESGFNPRADSGFYKGLFQHDPTYWDARAAKYGFAGASYYDVDAQIGVSTAMMAGGGWSHWGCDPGSQ
ncbi:MAG: ubiquitin-like domain-containing protein [Candidatus Saccharimonadales bacterium]